MGKRKASALSRRQGGNKRARTISKTAIHNLPDELIEVIFRHVLNTTTPDDEIENRTAVLRTCKNWYTIAAPLLWKHVAVNEPDAYWDVSDKVKLPKLAALTRALNSKPVLGEEVKSLSLYIHHYIREHLTTPYFNTITYLTSNMKSISIQIERLYTEDIFESMDLLRNTLLGIPLSCEAFHFRISIMEDTDNWLEAVSKDDWQEKPILPDLLDSICMQCRDVRLELPPPLLTSVFSSQDDNDNYPKLESLVICWMHLRKGGCDEYGDGWTSCKNLLTIVAAGKMPKLERALILRPGPFPDLWDKLNETPFTCVERNIKLDNLFEHPLVQMYEKSPPSWSFNPEQEKASLKDLAAERKMNTWALNLNHNQQQSKVEVKTFCFDNEVAFDMLLRYEELGWNNTPTGICMPRQMAVDFELVGEEETGQLLGINEDELDLEEHIWQSGLLLTVGDNS